MVDRDAATESDEPPGATGPTLVLGWKSGVVIPAGFDDLASQVVSAVDRLATEMFPGRSPARGEVRVRLVDDHEMREAHLEFMGEDSTTDVITFDLSEPDAPESQPDLDGPELTGSERDGSESEQGRSVRPGAWDVDLLICVDEAQRQARARGHAVNHELALYLVHGLLHCLGHDDHDEASAARMHAVEDEILVATGLAPVYASGRSDPVASRGGAS
ncbi:MAG: rRNA maturation RNase YbeY [Planctomycetota bacterium]|nr:rRNA maturation RNase YbeY [Planctomycetota bacterium]